MDLNALEQQVVEELLRHSRKDPIQASALATKMGLDLRGINATVRDLRRKGILIGASKRKPQGYYIPGDEQEVRDYMAGFRAELFDMAKTYGIQQRASRDFLTMLRNGDLFGPGIEL